MPYDRPPGPSIQKTAKMLGVSERRVLNDIGAGHARVTNVGGKFNMFTWPQFEAYQRTLARRAERQEAEAERQERIDAFEADEAEYAELMDRAAAIRRSWGGDA